MVKRPAGGPRLGEIGIAAGRVQPGAADVEWYAEMLIAGHRLEQLEGKPGCAKGHGGGKPRRAGANDHDINASMNILPRHNNRLIVGKFSGIRQCGIGDV